MLACLLAGIMPWASEISAQTMTVTTRDGQTHQFATADVENVTFDMGIEKGPFEITVSEITSVSAHLSIVPDDPTVRYYFDVCLKSDYERYGVDGIVDTYFNSLLQQYPGVPISVFLDGALSQGADNDDVRGLPSDTEMMCYAIAVDEDGKCAGTPSVVPFRTLPGGDPADCTFEISCNSVSSSAVTVRVHPSDPSVRYWMGVYPVSDWPGDVTMPLAVKQNIDQYVEMYGKPLEMVVEGVTFTADISMDESGLQPDTPYYVYVYAMDKEGNSQGPMFKKRFTTTTYDYSSANCSLKYRYYDGDELAAEYPEQFTKAKGRVVLQAIITPNEDAANYVWALGRGDMTDNNLYPEETAKNAVLQGGFINVPCKELIVDWGEATFLYFGSDAYGVDGPLGRTLANVVKEGVSPVGSYEELNPEALPVSPAPLKIMAVPGQDTDRFIMKRLTPANRIPRPMRNIF